MGTPKYMKEDNKTDMTKNRKLTSTPLLHHSVAESIFKEIVSRSAKYYYYVGAVNNSREDGVSPYVSDNIKYERQVRKGIISIKEIHPSDVSYIIPRIDWSPNVVYDMYDDDYSDKIIGVNLIKGGKGYFQNTTTVEIRGDDGDGAVIHPIVEEGSIIGFNIIEGGNGYLKRPDIIIHGDGIGAAASAVVNHTKDGAPNLYHADFYVLNSDNNIYKCIDNNNKSPSTERPSEVTPEPFHTSDGYTWKYMGTIPTHLSNKFLTKHTIPVKNSISDSFYSSGKIDIIVIDDGGSGYTFANIKVEGDGNRIGEKYNIKGLVVVEGGSGYTNAFATISPPFPDASSFSINSSYMGGQVLKEGTRYYKTLNAGITGPIAPDHISGIVESGNVDLEYIGEGITANVVIDDGVVTGISDMNLGVSDVILTNSGHGYTTAPIVSFTNSNAIAQATITNGNVTEVSVIDHGINTGNVSVIFGREWASGESVETDEQIFYQNNLYTVEEGGVLGTKEPTFVTGQNLNGTAALSYVGTPAIGYVKTKAGHGYSYIPTVEITGDGGGASVIAETELTSAVLYPVIDNGILTNIIIANGGEGYQDANIVIEGDGSGAMAHVVFQVGDLFTNQFNSELVAADGAIHVIKVVSGGYGYGDGAKVIIEGDGIGAAASVETSNGRLIKINILNEGRGYTYANIKIVGKGKGASARAILPPLGGHGADPVAELYANTLGFYTDLGNEKIHGLTINNEYRQFGIIKNLMDYKKNKRFNNRSGQSAWLVYSNNIDIGVFKEGVVVERASDGVKFTIITSETGKALIMPLFGGIPGINNNMKFENHSFRVTGVIEPDIDAMSGKMILMDNRVGFATTPEEKIVFRTNITY